jgi:hypothetical protein
VNGLVGDDHAAFGHELLEVAQAQREPMTFVPQRRRGTHKPMLRHHVTRRPSTPSGQPDNALVQNLGRGHYELATDVDSRHRLTAAFAEFAPAV